VIFNFSFLTRAYSILDFWQYCNIWGLAKCTWLITNVILHFTVYGSKITYGVQKALYLLTVLYHRILHTLNKLTLEIPRSFDQRKHPRGHFNPLISLPISLKLLSFSYVCLRDSFREILAFQLFFLFSFYISFFLGGATPPAPLKLRPWILEEYFSGKHFGLDQSSAEFMTGNVKSHGSWKLKIVKKTEIFEKFSRFFSLNQFKIMKTIESDNNM